MANEPPSTLKELRLRRWDSSLTQMPPTPSRAASPERLFKGLMR